MRSFKFARELEFKTDGNVFRLKRLIEETWQAENQKTGAYQQFTLPTLRQLYAEGKIELTEKPVFSYKTRTADDELIDGYLDNLSPSNKLDLISRLTLSVKTDITDRKKYFYKAFGAWESKQSADEIINDIRNGRTFNRKIEEL